MQLLDIPRCGRAQRGWKLIKRDVGMAVAVRCVLVSRRRRMSDCVISCNTRSLACRRHTAEWQGMELCSPCLWLQIASLL